MHLYEKKTDIQSSNTEGTFPLVIVISKVLEKLKELCLEQLSKLRDKINEETIKLVVIVPAIWEDFHIKTFKLLIKFRIEVLNVLFLNL